VTGIQFWVTKYLVNVIGVDQGPVTPVFGLTSITAPLLGVFLGGYIIDNLGGYQGAAGLALTLKCCAIFGLIASSCAILCVIIPQYFANVTVAFAVTVSFIFATLLFGGAIIPSATGVIVAAVAPELRQLSSAGSMFTFQMFGYALAPLVSSLVMDFYEEGYDTCGRALDELPNATCPDWQDGLPNVTLSNVTAIVDAARDEHLNKAKLTMGFRVCMFWGVFALIAMVGAWRSAVGQLKKEQKDASKQDNTVKAKAKAFREQVGPAPFEVSTV